MADNKTKANYVKGNSIFLYDSLTRDTTAEIFGDIANMVNKIPQSQKPDSNVVIESPYDINNSNAVIDIYINSSGGGVHTMNSILTFLNIARNRGAIIRTTVTGYAASCASIIAILGTPGYRIMYNSSYQVVHYGNSNIEVSANGEIDLAAKNEKRIRQDMINKYKTFTNLSSKEIHECMKTEHHAFSAQDCLDKHMCDWILTDIGTFIRRSDKQK